MTDPTHEHEPADAAALSASALAAALVVYIDPGPFDWIDLIAGITLLSVIFAFQDSKFRTPWQSWAYGTVIAFVFLLVAGVVLELVLGHGSMDGDCSRGKCESLVETSQLAIVWLVAAVSVHLWDRYHQAAMGRTASVQR